MTYFKKPDYFKLKTFEQSNLSSNYDKERQFNAVFGSKRSKRMSNARNKDNVVTTETVFKNISSCMYIINISSQCLFNLLYFYRAILCFS